jgi:4-aminobutyrate aminotransferase/(S)-3-amino-2-methylpropionate transaminase
MGRTGKMFAIEHWNVEPDIIILAKSLAAGMPLSAVVGRKEIMNSVHIGGLGGTYSGNPIACRAALAVLEIFKEENLLQKAEIISQKLEEKINRWQKKFKIVGKSHGIGAMRSFELVNEKTGEPAKETAREFIDLCYRKGLVILTSGKFGNIIRMLMPLVITDEQLEKGFNIIGESLQILTKNT